MPPGFKRMTICSLVQLGGLLSIDFFSYLILFCCCSCFQVEIYMEKIRLMSTEFLGSLVADVLFCTVLHSIGLH